MMRNTVRFQSPSFNSTESLPHFINPYCFGDDVAAWLKEKLQETGYQVEGPDQEDWGWYLVCRGSDGSYYLDIGHTGDEWQVILERRRSFREWMLGKPKIPSRELLVALHGILAAGPDTTVTEWLNLDDRGRESDVAQEP